MWNQKRSSAKVKSCPPRRATTSGPPTLPDIVNGGDSEDVNCTALSADAGGASQTFAWVVGYPYIVSGTDYWVVLQTTGYTYADGVTEVRWRTDANGAAGLNECAKYDSDPAPVWTSIGVDVGADLIVNLNLVTSVSDIILLQ